MKRDCDQFKARLVEAAEGRVDAQTREHLSGCEDCRKVVTELEQIFVAASLKRFDAPEEVLRRAVAIMPERKKVWARLLSSSLASSGARRASSDFQVVVGDDLVRIRLMATESANGWSISGKMPEPGWRGSLQGEELPFDGQGRFTFEAKTLDETGLVLAKGPVEIHVPPLSQLVDHGRDGRI